MSKKNIVIVIGFVFIVVFGYLLIQFNSFKEITRTTKRGEISEKIETKGVVIFDEKLYIAPDTVTVNHIYQNNDKVRKGTLICKLNDSSKTNQAETKAIAKEEYDTIIDEIKNGQYKVYEIKTLKENYIKSHYQQEKEVEEVQERVVSSAPKAIYAEEAGYVNYFSDRLELTYNFNNIENIEFKKNYNKFQDLKEYKVANEGEIIVKVANNYKWYVAIKMTPKEIELVREKKTVKVMLDQSDKMIGRLIKIIDKGEDSYIVLQFTEYAEKYMNKRGVSVDVIMNSEEGLIIPNTAIVTYKDTQGVFVENIDNTFSFKPVKIIVQNQYNAIIQERYFMEEELNGKKNKVYTVKMYDDVLIDGNRINKHKIR